jgi:hypothetical protein
VRIAAGLAGPVSFSVSPLLTASSFRWNRKASRGEAVTSAPALTRATRRSNQWLKRMRLVIARLFVVVVFDELVE